MDISVKITTLEEETLVQDFTQMLEEAGIESYQQSISTSSGIRPRGAIVPTEIIVALGSAGVFTAFCQLICKIIEKNLDKEITIERGDVKVIIKGHSLSEEKSFLSQIAKDFSKIAPEFVPMVSE